MNPQRPTTLRMLAEHCPRAVDFYEAGAPADHSVYAAGTAAHDCLHAIGDNPSAERGPLLDAVCLALMTTGRAGVDAEPPLPPDAVFAGRRLAERYADTGAIPTQDAHFERGYGFAAGWRPVPYAEADWFRTRLDVVFRLSHEEEDFAGDGIVVRDYKSAWPADESYLDSVQLHAQAVAVWKTHPDVDFVRREIVNLRTLQTFEATTWSQDFDVLETWARDIELAIDAASHRPRIARPGIGCIGCPYAGGCPDVAAFYGSARPDQMAEAYAAAMGVARALEPFARAQAGEGAVLTRLGTVGWQEQAKSTPRDGAATALWEAWAPDRKDDGIVRGLLVNLGLGVTQIKNAARGLFPDRKQKAEREAFAEGLLETVKQRRFGIWREKATTDDRGEKPGEEG